MKRLLILLLLVFVAGIFRSTAQIASFSFSGTPSTVSGWTNLPGDPHSGAQTATMGGVTVSTISAANWVPNAVPSNVYDYGGNSDGTYFPAAVMVNTWLQWNGNSGNLAVYNASVPQLLLSGLNPDSTYILRMSGSDNYYTGMTQYTVAGASVSGSQYLNTYKDSAQGVTFTGVRPDANGHINVYVNAPSASGNLSFAFISGLQVFSGTAINVGTPAVALTAPVNGTVQSEGGNFILTATATETGGSIAKVEFYADTTKIGEADASPYTMTWVDPDPGTYQLSAKATDAIGTIATASVNVGIQSLNYFWSTTGNAATNGDSNFVGTVDSNRLSFRTKNIERMNISAIGNIGIGTDSPTAQLHTTGSVRLAGLTSDSSPSRIVVTDSTGKLYYQNVGSSGVLSPGPGLGGTSTGLALGDSIPGPGPHSFTSNRYQYLNGYQYSIGGSVNDPVNQPVFRAYDNGDLAVGTTMDRSVNTGQLSGMRYYSKLGVLQIGATDRLDTTISKYAYNNYEGSGILINSDDSNSFKRIYASVIAGDHIVSDSNIYRSFINGEGMQLDGHITQSTISGYAHIVNGGLLAGLISGAGHHLTKPSCSVLAVTGYENTTGDTARNSLIGGAVNTFGGLGQLVVGQYLIDRSPSSAVFGNSNVDFSSLPWTGLQGTSVANLASYPVLAVGNQPSAGVLRSNALTVLYNGRTQINTTGITTGLTQAQVTPAAALDVVSTNTGVLLPRLTTAQRNAIVSGDLRNGLLLYNTDSSVFQYYNGSVWNSVGAGSSGGTGGRWLFANGTAYDSLDNIAIGTSNPQNYKLAVNGAGIFTKIVAKPQANWPDYVFDKSYDLLSLGELAQYIKTHHHLPDVIPATEIARNGIDLGAEQTTLLKKVEELTLYLIDENKSLADQNRQLAQQKSNLSEQAQQLADQNKQLNDQNARLAAQQKEIDELKAMIQANHKQ